MNELTLIIGLACFTFGVFLSALIDQIRKAIHRRHIRNSNRAARTILHRI